MGGYAGILTWLSEKEWRPHLLLPSVKGFPEKQQSLWEISGLRRGGRQIAEYPLGAFLRKTLETLGSIPKGSRSLVQPSLRSSVVHTLHPGKQASKTLSSSVTLQHSQVVIKHQLSVCRSTQGSQQCQPTWPTLLPAQPRTNLRRWQHVAISCKECMEHLKLTGFK